MDSLEKIAAILKTLTHDELMEMATWFACWTVAENGPLKKGEQLCNDATMAINIIDWADQQLDDENE